MHANSSSLSILLGAHGLTGIEVKLCCARSTAIIVSCNDLNVARTSRSAATRCTRARRSITTSFNRIQSRRHDAGVFMWVFQREQEPKGSKVSTSATASVSTRRTGMIEEPKRTRWPTGVSNS